MPATNDDTRYPASYAEDDSLWDRMSEMAASDDDEDDDGWDDEEDDWDDDWDDDDDDEPDTLRRRRFDDER